MTGALRPRLKLLMAILAGLGLIVIGQLAYVQIVNHERYVQWGRENQIRLATWADPPRGPILDRNGNILAGNSVEYSIEAAPVYIPWYEEEDIAAALAPVLHLPAGHIRRSLEGDDSWAPILSPVSKEVGEHISGLKLTGIYARPLWRRAYPEGMLAAHILGFSITETIGYGGSEEYYNTSLVPFTTRPRTLVDAVNNQVPWQSMPITRPHAGAELHLTIDREIQVLVERELAASLEEFEAEAGTIIVMDPRTFELLAVASFPTYDPERFAEYAAMDEPPFEDPAVRKQYEPGSVFKVLTVAAAIDAGLVSPETVYHDLGFIEVGGRVIRNATRRAYGDQTVRDLLVKSLNVGAAWLSTSMGADTFYKYLLAFGIGNRTDVDLAGEVAGQLWLPDDLEHWHDSNLGTNSFGQGLAVTPLQMIAAIATIANDGTRLIPHVRSHTISHDGTVTNYRPVAQAQVVSPETARLVTEMMVAVVEDGATKAKVPGYQVAGKTGTAEIPIPGGYDPDGTIASFVGFGPVPDPRFVILVRLDRPQTSPWGSQTATVTFQRIASRLFIMAGIPPQFDQLAEARS